MYKILYEIQTNGDLVVNVVRTTGSKDETWGRRLFKGADLNEALPCFWEGDIDITPIYLDDRTKAAILSEWAKLEA